MSVPCLSNSTWALIPQRVENLLPGCKNLGVTHHQWLLPVASCGMEHWRVGGPACGFCLDAKKAHARSAIKSLCSPIFNGLCKKIKGIEIAWPKLTPR